jgi:hypothetical protein
MLDIYIPGNLQLRQTRLMHEHHRHRGPTMQCLLAFLRLTPTSSGVNTPVSRNFDSLSNGFKYSRTLWKMLCMLIFVVLAEW